MMQSSEEVLRRLAFGDRTPVGDAGAGRLDDLTAALIRVAVLVPLDAPQSSYQEAVEAAVRAGATLDDLVATLLATLDTVGMPRAVSAAPRSALAAAYDIDAALEETPVPQG